MTLRLDNGQISLTMVPDFGARITELTDLGTGRQWLVEGPLEGEADDDAAYGARAARGWDECFPTVSPCAHPAWGKLRNHGQLWGRPWTVVDASDTHIEARYRGPNYDFTRTIRLAGAGLVADYRLFNSGADPLICQWSQHCLLATTPDDRIVLTGMENMHTGGTGIAWPHHHGRDLSRIGPLEDGFALKAYAMTPGPASAEIVGEAGGLRLAWDDVPAFGLWLSYGGWPQDNPVHQIALEPTSAGADDLNGAEALHQAWQLPPQTEKRWSVRMTLTRPQQRNG